MNIVVEHAHTLFNRKALLSFVVDFGQKTLIEAEGGDSCGTKQAGRDPARAKR